MYTSFWIILKGIFQLAVIWFGIHMFLIILGCVYTTHFQIKRLTFNSRMGRYI